MKILHIYKSYYKSYGGIEQFINTITSNDLENNHDILCVSNKNQVIYNKPHGKILTFKKTFQFASNPFSFSLFMNMKKLLNAYDIIHIHYPFPTIDIYFYFLNIYYKEKKIIITYHSDIVRQKILNFFYAFFRRKLFKKSAIIIGTSKVYIDTSPLKKIFNKITTYIIPIGIRKKSFIKRDISRFKSLPKKFFLFVGVHRYYKGLDILLKAITNTDIPVVIAGTGPETKKLLRIKTIFKIDNAIFVGKVSDEEKYFLINRCYALVFPSNARSEAFGISILEAYSQKKSVITSDIESGMKFVNLNNVTGLSFSNNDSNSLLKKMIYLYENKGINKYLSSNAYQRFNNLFTEKNFIKNYQKIYEFFNYEKNIGKYTFSIVIYNISSYKKQFYNLLKTIVKIPNSTLFLIVNGDESNIDIDQLIIYSNIKIIFTFKNIGFGAGHNRVLKYINGYSKIHFILNPDILLDSHKKLLDMIHSFEKDEDSIHLTVPIIDITNKYFGTFRRLPSPFELIKRRFFHTLINFQEPFNQLGNISRKNMVYSGCFIGIKTEYFLKINGFDERFFLYMEDIDLIRRLNILGKFMFYKKFKIQHVHAKGSYNNTKLLIIHCISAIKYFNKWGWLSQDNN